MLCITTMFSYLSESIFSTSGMGQGSPTSAHKLSAPSPGDDLRSKVCDSFTQSNCTQRFFLGNRLRFLCGNDTVCGCDAFCDEKGPNLLLAAEIPCDFTCDSKNR